MAITCIHTKCSWGYASTSFFMFINYKVIINYSIIYYSLIHSSNFLCLAFTGDKRKESPKARSNQRSSKIRKIIIN